MSVDYAKRCAECSELRVIKGIDCCYECFDTPCKEVDDCPLGITIESVKTAQTLTTEQKKVEKQMKNSDTHEISAENAKKERKPRENPTKEGIIEDISHFLAENGYENVKIVNKTREIAFVFENQLYKLTVSATRKPKT